MSFEEKLITLVRDRPILYDVKHKHSKRNDIKLNNWREISDLMDVSGKLYYNYYYYY